MRIRLFLRDALGLAGVDAGEGWLICALPPAEVAVHPAENNDAHELYLIARVNAFIARMTEAGVETSAVESQTWGRLTHVTLPCGGRLGVCEPNHVRPR